VSLALPGIAPGEVWLVGAGPGDPGLLTLLAQRALATADVVVHDALVPACILALARPDARPVPVGKRKGKPSTAQLRINASLVREARAGRRVLRLKGGDPFVFGRGGEEALALRAAAIPFRVVPGISAGTAAPALAGIPLTHRGLARSVAFVTGHGVGGAAPRGLELEGLAQGAETLVLFMAASAMAAIVPRLLAAGRQASEPLAFVIAAGTPQQERLLTTLGEAIEVAARLRPGPPVLVVLGGVVALADLLMPDLPGSPETAMPAAPATQLAS
jgi:uroporphyrin-III C-methyltransferase